MSDRLLRTWMKLAAIYLAVHASLKVVQYFVDSPSNGLSTILAGRALAVRLRDASYWIIIAGVLATIIVGRQVLRLRLAFPGYTTIAHRDRKFFSLHSPNTRAAFRTTILLCITFPIIYVWAMHSTGGTFWATFADSPRGSWGWYAFKSVQCVEGLLLVVFTCVFYTLYLHIAEIRDVVRWWHRQEHSMNDSAAEDAASPETVSRDRRIVQQAAAQTLFASVILLPFLTAIYVCVAVAIVWFLDGSQFNLDAIRRVIDIAGGAGIVFTLIVHYVPIAVGGALLYFACEENEMSPRWTFILGKIPVPTYGAGND